MKKIFIALLMVGSIFFLTSCFKVKSEMVEKIKIGMTTEQVFKIIPDSKDNWHDCNNGVYRYGWNFYAPDGYKRTFWVDIKDDKVVSLITI